MQRDAAHVPFVDSGSYPLRAGNAVRPLVDGEPAFRRICLAVEAAHRSVWVTVAFLEPDFALPDGRGSLFDVLDRAHARGLDVRVLFWRQRELALHRPNTNFGGTEDDLRFLRERGKPFDIAAGELAVVDQYRRAVEAAERTIYIEGQAIGSPEIVDRLHAALDPACYGGETP